MIPQNHKISCVDDEGRLVCNCGISQLEQQMWEHQAAALQMVSDILDESTQKVVPR